MGGGSISAAKGSFRPAVTWQDFNDVVNSNQVSDDANLDLVDDLFSNETISHTGTWGRNWLWVSDADKARSTRIRNALADAIRFQMDVAPGKTTGNPTLDAILKRIQDTKRPLTKREVRQVINEVGKIIDIATARKVLSASINQSGDICRPDGRGKQFENEIAAFRQKVLETKTGTAQTELLAKLKDLMVRHNDILRSFVLMSGTASKLLLATATDGEAEYLDNCKRTSHKILKKVQEFDGLVDELKQLREDANKTEMNDKPDADVEKPKTDDKPKTDEEVKNEQEVENEVKVEKQDEEKPKVEEKQDDVKQDELKNEPPKNEPLKGNLVGKNLEGHVSNGIFNGDVLPQCEGRKGLETNDEYAARYDQYIVNTSRKLREKIIPNWTSLTDRLGELRRQAMNILGIKPQFEECFMRWCPDFDPYSDAFLSKIREAKISGKNVREAENAILSKCRVKDDWNLLDEFGNRVASVSVVVGEKPDEPADNTIYIGKDKMPLAAKDIETAINEFCAEKNLGNVIPLYIDNSIEGLLNMGDVGRFNEAFKECVRNPEALEKLLMAEVESLRQFTGNEREMIAKMIRDAVIVPITTAKNIWDIKELSFMRNLIALCNDEKVKDAQGVRDVVRMIIKAQVEENFALKQAAVKGKSLIQSGKTHDWHKLLPARTVISSALGSKRTAGIGEGMGIRQSGGANCFMVSIVNALLSNEKGRTVLKNCFVNRDMRYHFKDRDRKEFTIVDQDVEDWEKENAQFGEAIEAMSKLERVIWTAWHKVLKKEGNLDMFVNDYRYFPGRQCPAIEVGLLFGLEVSREGQNDTRYGVGLAENKLSKWVKARNYLGEGQFVIAHQGTVEGGHYVAVTGAEANSTGEKYFTYSDSLYEDKSRFDLDSIHLGDGDPRNGNSSVILLRLRED